MTRLHGDDGERSSVESVELFDSFQQAPDLIEDPLDISVELWAEWGCGIALRRGRNSQKLSRSSIGRRIFSQRLL